jgi:hypothetical protein
MTFDRVFDFGGAMVYDRPWVIEQGGADSFGEMIEYGLGVGGG